MRAFLKVVAFSLLVLGLSVAVAYAQLCAGR